VEHKLYLFCAVVGCTLVALQFVLQLFGWHGHTDVGSDHGMDVHGDTGDGHSAEGHGNLFFGILSFKAFTAFAGIFGLVGLLLQGRDLGPLARVSGASLAGVAAMFGVGRLMYGMSQLQASGTLDLQNAVGSPGRVHLRIPPRHTGRGKVIVEIQGRSLELAATTDGEGIPTGATVKVVGVEGMDTVTVIPAEEVLQ